MKKLFLLLIAVSLVTCGYNTQSIKINGSKVNLQNIQKTNQNGVTEITAKTSDTASASSYSGSLSMKFDSNGTIQSVVYSSSANTTNQSSFKCNTAACDDVTIDTAKKTITFKETVLVAFSENAYTIDTTLDGVINY